MADSDFVPTTWVDGVTAITTAQLNRMEAGVERANDGVDTLTAAVDGKTSPTEVGDILSRDLVRVGYFASDSNPGREAEFTAAAGEVPTAVLRPFGYTDALDVTRMNTLHTRGQMPFIAWMPWGVADVTVQPNYQLGDIIAGTHDAYMTTFLTAVRDLGFEVAIRWAHEMNGDWYPWAEQANGNSAGQYITAWRHVVDLARGLGANNIRWVWSPNTPYPGSQPYSEVYPGDDYVDVVATQGYNWGADGPDGSRTVGTVFDAALAQLDVIAPDKPVWITEVGCVEDVATPKPEWIETFFAWLPATRVSLFMWFDDIASGYDWRVDSTPEASAAFTAGMAALRETTRPSGPDIRGAFASSADLATVVTRLNTTPGSSTSMWGSGGMESIPRIGTTQLPGFSGRLRLTYFTAPTTVTVNALAVACGDTGHVSATLTRMAIFTVDGSGNLTKVAQTANDTALLSAAYDSATSGLATAGGFPAGYTFQVGRYYAVGILDVASTPATVRGASVDFAGYPPVLNRHINGQTDIAASYTAGSLTSFYQPVLIVGLHF